MSDIERRRYCGLEKDHIFFGGIVLLNFLMFYLYFYGKRAEVGWIGLSVLLLPLYFTGLMTLITLSLCRIIFKKHWLLFVSLLPISLILLSLSHWGAIRISTVDLQKTFDRGAVIIKTLEDYKRDNGYYPDSLYSSDTSKRRLFSIYTKEIYQTAIPHGSFWYESGNNNNEFKLFFAPSRVLSWHSGAYYEYISEEREWKRGTLIY